jgi:Fic family protein
VERGLVVQAGAARATTYAITPRGRGRLSIDLAAYRRRPPAERASFTTLQPAFFGLFEGSVPPVVRARLGLDRPRQLAGASSAAQRRELQRFVTEFAWKSSAIEGNTYDVFETEALLTEGILAPGHPKFEAVMIRNHAVAFEHVWQDVGRYRTLDREQVTDLHRLLVQGLDVPFGLRDQPVGISGTVYRPPNSADELDRAFTAVLDRINGLAEPAEKALACLTLVPYVQPFTDGNKRTSRLLANAVLLAHDYPPVSFFTADETTYKASLVLFYEQGILGNFRSLVTEQLAYSAERYFVQRRDIERQPERPDPGQTRLRDDELELDSR